MLFVCILLSVNNVFPLRLTGFVIGLCASIIDNSFTFFLFPAITKLEGYIIVGILGDNNFIETTCIGLVNVGKLIL